MNILIVTGIYPPKIGGPAEYSKNLRNTLELAQNRVKIGTFGLEDIMPTGVRHLWFMLKILPNVLWSDFIIIMDTFSVGLPTVFLSKIFLKKTIIRTGGDFLWEQYVERTGKKVLFRNFYSQEKNNFSQKEKIIYALTKWTLQNSSRVVFSTEWQRGIFIDAYNLKQENTEVIENYYGEKEDAIDIPTPVFVGSTRELVWKNMDTLKEVFDDIKNMHKEVELYTKNLPYESFMHKIKNSYAVVLVSLGDISPNMILDAIRNNKPFICTREIGIYDRIKDLGIFVDPLNKLEIKEAVLKLLDPTEYNKAQQKIRDFKFTHSWKEISQEFLEVYKKIK